MAAEFAGGRAIGEVVIGTDYWQTILQTAVIGSERQPLALPAGTDALGKLLAQINSDGEESLLSAAATMSLYETAGRQPQQVTLPPDRVCAQETLTRCSPRAGQHLAMMLQGQQAELLPEWFQAIARRGWHVLEESLPLLLQTGHDHKELRDVILPTLGERGLWLATQNSAWHYAIRTDDGSVWETGSQQQRMAYFTQLRKREPQRARQLLQDVWPQEASKERAEFLTLMAVGLSVEDETFLEPVLDDRRKEVRKAAADLLEQLPQSGLCQRMLDRAQPLLAFKRKLPGRHELEITLPDVCDKAMLRDGMEPKPFFHGLGEKGWWLQQMLATIPPRVWQDLSGWTAQELIAAAKRNEWKGVLLEAWSQAARRYNDAAWAEALLKELYKQGQAVYLLLALPEAKQEAFVMRLLAENPSLHSTQPARNFLAFCRHRWSAQLSRAVIKSLLHHTLSEGDKVDWGWAGFLNEIGLRLPVELLPETAQLLTDAVPPAERAPALERFLDFIQFRYEMLKEINA